jgi:hypothetical protein
MVSWSEGVQIELDKSATVNLFSLSPYWKKHYTLRRTPTTSLALMKMWLLFLWLVRYPCVQEWFHSRNVLQRGFAEGTPDHRPDASRTLLWNLKEPWRDIWSYAATCQQKNLSIRQRLLVSLRVLCSVYEVAWGDKAFRFLAWLFSCARSVKVDSRVIPMQDMVLVLMWLVEETLFLGALLSSCEESVLKREQLSNICP